MTITTDTLDDVLDVACEVLTDYGAVAGNSRIERLARWLVANLGGEPYGMVQSGQIARLYVAPDLVVDCVGSRFTVTDTRSEWAPEGDDARRAQGLAVAAVKAAELVKG